MTNSKALCADIKDFYLNTSIEICEYMKFQLKIIPYKTIKQYKLKEILTDAWLYIDIRKGIYGLKQMGKLANDQLKEYLAEFGYTPAPMTSGDMQLITYFCHHA